MSTTPGTDLDKPFDPTEFANIGMEDVAAGDLVVPRLSIDHKNGLFVNNLSKEQIPVLQCVIFGLVKQRIMWDDDVQDGDKPQCKSPDHDNGFPQMRTDIPYEKQFPWDESNFDKANFPEQDGQIILPCASCAFNQWGKDPRSGKSIPPRCSEQHTYPLSYTQDGGDTWTTAILTFQRTGIKPSKSYLSLFNQAGMPMFTSFTELSLSVQTRGTVTYSVPIFKKGAASDRNLWRSYANTYMQLRDFLRTPPRRQVDDAPAAVSDNTNTAPETEEPPVAEPPAQAPAPAPTPAAAPAQAPAPAAAPAPAQAPAPAAAPAPASAPVEGTVVSPPAQPVTDDLPF